MCVFVLGCVVMFVIYSSLVLLIDEEKVFDLQKWKLENENKKARVEDTSIWDLIDLVLVSGGVYIHDLLWFRSLMKTNRSEKWWWVHAEFCHTYIWLAELSFPWQWFLDFHLEDF